MICQNQRHLRAQNFSEKLRQNFSEFQMKSFNFEMRTFTASSSLKFEFWRVKFQQISRIFKKFYEILAPERHRGGSGCSRAWGCSSRAHRGSRSGHRAHRCRCRARTPLPRASCRAARPPARRVRVGGRNIQHSLVTSIASSTQISLFSLIY